MDVDGKSWEIPRIKDRLGVNFFCTRVLKIHLGDQQHPADVPVDWMFWCFFSRFPHPCRIFQTPLHLLMGQWWTISTSNWGIWGQRLPISNLECARFFIGLEAQSTHSCDFLQTQSTHSWDANLGDLMITAPELLKTQESVVRFDVVWGGPLKRTWNNSIRDFIGPKLWRVGNLQALCRIYVEN